MNLNEDYVNYRYFYEPTNFSIDTLIISDGMGHINSRTFSIDRKHFDNYVVIYVFEGVFHLIQYGVHHTLLAGQAVLLDLRHPHKYYNDTSFATQILWFHYRGTPCDSLMQALSKMQLLPYIFTDASVLHDICHCFTITIDHNDDYEFTLSCFIYQLLLKWTAPGLQCHLSSQRNEDDILLSTIHDYAIHNINQPITLDELAALIPMSKYHFCRVFSKQFQMTPMQYITELKINMAKKYLLYTNDSIQSIARAVGFTDQGHFSKVFKQVTGKTASSYRK